MIEVDKKNGRLIATPNCYILNPRHMYQYVHPLAAHCLKLKTCGALKVATARTIEFNKLNDCAGPRM